MTRKNANSRRKKRATKPRSKAIKTVVVQQQTKRPRPKGSLGSRVGARLGGFLGGGAQQLFKHITGFGAYRVRGNTLMSGEVPIIHNSGNASGTLVRHREYIADVLPTATFTLNSYSINPGNSDLFPWLSAIASSYEKYKFRGLIFEFKAMSASAFLGTNGNVGLGTVIMATQYNALFPDFPDKRTMENYEFACSGKPNETFIHPVECSPSQTVVEHMYVQAAGSATLGDARFYDLGNFQIATIGFDSAATGVIGELWATYEVELYKPKITQPLGIGNLGAHFFGVSNISVPAQPVTSNLQLSSTSTCPCSISFNASTGVVTLAFPTECAGNFQITHSITAGSGVSYQFTLNSFGTNISPLNIASQYSSGSNNVVYYANSGNGSTTAVTNYFVTINNATDGQSYVYFSWVNGVTLTNAVEDWYITQLPYSYKSGTG